MHPAKPLVLDVAAEHDGVITRSEARALGMHRRMVDACLADGLLVPVAPEVFRVRGAPQTASMAVAAAVASARGVASHATAARLSRLEVPVPEVPLHVTVDADVRQPRLRRVRVETGDRTFFPVRVHRCRTHGEPTVVVDGIPCTDGARTLVDLAGTLPLAALEDAFEAARRLGLVSIESLARRFELLGGRGRPGTPKLREVLAGARPGVLASKLEGRAWRMLRASGLPEPCRQLRVDVTNRCWYRLDFAWPELLVAFETEGFEWHGTRAQWKRDRIRVAALERLGWRHVVGTWDDVVLRPVETVDRIAAALSERRLLAAVAR